MAYRLSLSHILRSRTFAFCFSCFIIAFLLHLLCFWCRNIAFCCCPPVLRLLSALRCVLSHFGVAVSFVFFSLTVWPGVSRRWCVFRGDFGVLCAVAVVVVLVLYFLASVVCCVVVFLICSLLGIGVSGCFVVLLFLFVWVVCVFICFGVCCVLFCPRFCIWCSGWLLWLIQVFCFWYVFLLRCFSCVVHAWLVGSGCFCLFVWCSLCVVVVYSAFVGCVYVILRCFLWLVVYCPIVNVFCVFVFFGCGITWFLYEEEPPGGDPGGLCVW